MIDTVTVDLADRSYPIYIGPGVLDEPALLLRHIGGSQVVIITNDVVAPLWLPALEGMLKEGSVAFDVFRLPDGEAEKNLENYGRILDFLVARRHNRTTTVIALGGGVVGDMAGFAAATYQRGVGFVQVPTTLLAQVDSSVGGKTAVNHAAGKNLIGAFYQPQAVLADTRVLQTLPPRQLRAGLAEVLKYGIIRDAGFFAWIAAEADALLALQADALGRAIRRSCEVKADVVSEDERENGVRAILNFGHTFGHALEALTGYTTLLHGEAVAIGMVMAADLSWRQGLISAAAAAAVKRAVAALQLPVAPPVLPAEQMLSAMGMDKKVRDGQLRLVLMRGIGDAFVTGALADTRLEETLVAGESLCGV